MTSAHAYKWRNCITNEAIVLQWLIWNPCETSKLWKSEILAGALLSVKCCCFDHEKVMQFWSSPSEEEGEEERITILSSGNFLVQYFHDAFWHHWVCCSENTRRWTVCCHKGLLVLPLLRFERFFYYCSVPHIRPLCISPPYIFSWSSCTDIFISQIDPQPWPCY